MSSSSLKHAKLMCRYIVGRDVLAYGVGITGMRG